MKVLALDIGGTMLKIALVNEDGTMEQFREVPSNAKSGAASLLNAAFQAADSYNGYDCIGISTSGQVDVENGIIAFANQNIPDYTGVNLRKLFSERYGCNCAVENDVNAAALGEAFFGAGRAFKDFLCVTYGTGVGGGIVIDRQVYHGADGVAGEVGHIVTHPGGLPCGCGQRGCYEQYASTKALVAMAQSRDPSIQNGRQLFEQLERQVDVINGWIEEISLGLATLIHVLNPAAVVLGGGIMNEEYVVKQLRTMLYPKLMKSYGKVQLVQAECGNNAGLLGAAYLAMKM